jgi:hypothetical protein
MKDQLENLKNYDKGGRRSFGCTREEIEID